MARRLANLLIFLALTAELEGFVFHGLWSTPLTTLGSAIFLGLPGLKIPLWDLVLLVTLFTQMGKKGQKVLPMLGAIKLSILGVGMMALWGFVHGGSLYQSVFQVRTFVLSLFVALLVASVCKTRSDVEALGRVVVFAALYRSCVLLAFYYLVAKDLPKELPALTDHCDSALFVGGLFLLVINALEQRTSKAIRWAIFGSALLLVAIALNNRRLAWLLIGVGAAFVYLVLPPSPVKRKLNRVGLFLTPVFLAYLVAGWGRPTGIFKPVGSISTMFGTHQDASSVMRDIENYNLVVTLKSNPLLGVGFGYEYIEAVRAYDISSIFKQYRYLPHNSLLGFIAFTGMLGFAAIWQAVVVSVYFNSRAYRAAREPVLRVAALWCLVAVVIIELQMWGDIGLNHLGVNVLLAVVLGLAARLPVLTGAWPPRTEASQPG